MSLPLWSKHDAEMYRSLSLFPTELEKEFLTPDEFRGNFRDLNGRPVQDILEALSLYSRQGYFSYEIMLTPAYLKHGQALAQVTAALNTLRPKPSALPNERNGLSGQVYAKVLAERPLTRIEASRLPDEAKPYLVFKLTDIARDKLREELAIYSDNTLIQPSRLAKITHAKAAPKLPQLNISEIRLKPENYDRHTGVLSLAPLYDRQIAGKAGVTRSNGQKYEQCRMMECVFKTDKTLKHGVEIHAILGINKNIVDKTTTKKIENTKTAINKKVAADGGPKNLLKIQNGKVFLNNSYL